GSNLARLTERIFKQGKFTNIIVISGSGNNGGGGLVAARRLNNWDLPVQVWLPKGLPRNEVPANQYKRVVDLKILTYTSSSPPTITGSVLLIDAYIGYNFEGDLSDDAINVISFMKALDVISLDIPSGVDSTSGISKCDLKPIATITLAWPKTSICKLDKQLLGNLYLADIGVPSWVFELNELYDESPP
ncbi:MAG: NAD(P)H-hydrate epimerase, partial [Candidatus Heimdallarchaeota archaeon]|nr:NAD(P)H-hydrate epimerase [Candidatus Heimdallarchaeota archaeon]